MGAVVDDSWWCGFVWLFILSPVLLIPRFDCMCRRPTPQVDVFSSLSTLAHRYPSVPLYSPRLHSTHTHHMSPTPVASHCFVTLNLTAYILLTAYDYTLRTAIGTGFYIISFSSGFFFFSFLFFFICRNFFRLFSFSSCRVPPLYYSISLCVCICFLLSNSI
ncbi:hypothetical protein GALMADRAFT_1255956 [Galerina marginata CBS 339.88]|uniref:Uncharacterized protein n=1 Tax=Galerina marginata (strain CBS 339.88) TaxID=685588 RepID=A0A067TF91_GALM3|nr:hypothetical protein GALMADRAFT_1255956 [Galerina marginata CBS 339.88]